jgi:Domain of unknown function (DUF4440)
MPVVRTAVNGAMPDKYSAAAPSANAIGVTAANPSEYGTTCGCRSVILDGISNDVDTLTALNEQFIDAFREGSWEQLEPILSPRFQYLDGASGEVWPKEKYIRNLAGHPAPQLEIDEVVVHVDGRIAVVSARTSRGTGRYNRYVDTYERRAAGWLCVHACVWPLQIDHQ